jgi:hypothetical protein
VRHVTRDEIEANLTSTMARIEHIVNLGQAELPTYRAVLSALSIHALMTGQTELSAKIQEVTIGFPQG